MAFENLAPYQDIILSLREPGSNRRSLAQIVDTMREEHQVNTSIGTLSRYLKQIAPDKAVRDPTQSEHEAIDTLAMQIEIMTEIVSTKQELRAVIEQQDGQLRNLTYAIDELKIEVAKKPTSDPAQGNGNAAGHSVANNSTPPLVDNTQRMVPPLRRIWKRAFVITFLLNLLLIGGAALWLSNRY